MKSSSRSVLASTAIAALMLPVLAACGSDGGGADDPADASSPAGSPAGEAAASSATVTVTAADGCTIDHTTLAAGGIDFTVTNKDATAVTEVELLSGDRIVGEKENLPPGFDGTFSVTVPAGEYYLYCPGASNEKTPITVTGEAAAADTDTDTASLLRQAGEGYAAYVSTQVGYLLTSTKKLARTLHGTDLDAAKVAYAKARPFYEKIEPVAESFSVGKVSLDANIDARENDVPAEEFMGFHRIEKGLWADGSLEGLAPYGDRLVKDVKRLKKLTDGLSYQATELANGAQELLDEVAASKITGEEERYSHIDMLDVANNVEGSQQAFAQLEPVVSKVDQALVDRISGRFDELNKLVDGYRAPKQPSGYKLYSDLSGKDKRALAAAIKAVQEPLSQVASKVAG